MQGPSDQAGAQQPDGDCHTRGLWARNDDQVFSHKLRGAVFFNCFNCADCDV